MEIFHRFVVISGVPGCGKSSVGRELAQCLNTPYFDKDRILEAYFSKIKCTDEETRHRLSREADQEFQAAALNCSVAVLDSFWRHPSANKVSGTPSSWLKAPEIHAVEVFCQCPTELAAERFLERKRHVGHVDNKWDQASLMDQSRILLQELPLGIGTLIEIDTTLAVDIKTITAQVKTVLGI